SALLRPELARLGGPVRRTDRDGDVAVVSRSGALSTVERGVPASTNALTRPVQPPDGTVSVGHATMGQWLHPVLAPPLRLRPPSYRLASYQPWSCSSATRSCSSPARSSRSAPAPARPIRPPTSRGGPG